MQNWNEHENYGHDKNSNGRTKSVNLYFVY